MMQRQYGDYYRCNTEKEVRETVVQSSLQAVHFMNQIDVSPIEVGKIEIIIKEAPKDEDYKYSVGWKFNVKEETK